MMLERNAGIIADPTYGKPEEGFPLPFNELQAKIKSLEQELKDHEGELVLVAVRCWERISYDSPERDTPYGLDGDYYLGIVAAPYLVVEDFQVVVGTTEHVRIGTRSPHEVGLKKTGQINDWRAWRQNLNRDSKLVVYDFDMEPKKKLLEIIVGNQEVSRWIEREITEGRIPPYVLDAKEEVPDLYEKDKARCFDRDLLNSFQTALQTLGRTLPLPQALSGKAE